MIKAKEIKCIIDNIKKYKNLLMKETDSLERFKIEIELKEHQYKLMDIEFQLLNIDVCLYKDSELYKEIFVDRYINGLTQNQLVDKYDMVTTTLYKKLKIARTAFECKKHL